jgi:ankyrin repeat protein
MKLFLSTACLSLLLIISSLGFSQVTAPFSVNYICVNGSGSVWAFGEGGSNGKGLYYQFNGWNFIDYNIAEGVKAAHSTYGEIHIVNGKGEVREWNNNNKRWFTYAGIGAANDIYVSNRNGNNKYVLGSVNGKYGLWMVPNISTNAASWQAVWVDGWGASLIKATDDVNGTIYAVTNSGRLISRTTGGVDAFIDTGNRFIVDVLIGEDGKLYMMERGGKILKRNPNGSWTDCRLSATSWGVGSKGEVIGVVNGEIQKMLNGSWSKISVDNPNKKDAYGNTPLTAALVSRNSSSAQKAINNGTNVNLANNAGDYPIHIAVKNQDVSLVNMMLVNKADPNKKDKRGHTALYYAVKTNRVDVAKALFSNGKMDANLEKNIAFIATENRNHEMLAFLGTKNVDLSPGLTPAVGYRDAALVMTLLNNGAKITSNGEYEHAVDLKAYDIAEILIKNGADKKGAVEYAVTKQDKELITICLSNGCPAGPVIDYGFKQNDVNLITDLIVTHSVNPTTVMDKAVPGAKSGSGTVNLNMAKVALQNGAQADPYFNYAISSNNMQLTDVLLINGGSPKKLLEESVNANNMRYASHAFDNGAQASNNGGLFLKCVENDNAEMSRLFIDRGGNTADSRLIKTSVTKDNIEITRMLLDNGASAGDRSLIQTSVKQSNIEMTSMLISSGAPTDDPAVIQTAVDQSNTEMTRLLLSNGAPATSPKLIQSAVDKSNSEITTLLIASGASAADPNLIQSAVSQSNLGMTQLLIDNGAPVNSRKLIQTSVDNSKLDITQLLIANGASAADPALIKSAVGNKNLPIAKLLLENGAPSNDKSLMTTAVGNQSKGIVTELLNYGADPNAGMQTSVDKNYTDIAVILLEAGADATNPKLINGAARNGNLVIVTGLVERGAKPDNGALASINGGQEKVFNYLMDQGADAKNIKYMEATVRKNNYNMFKRLVDAGAPVDYTAANGENLLHISTGNGNVPMTKVLVEKGAALEQKNSDGLTPLLLVVTDGRNNLELCTALVEGGADVNATNAKGKTVLKVAKGKKVKDYLKANGATK